MSPILRAVPKLCFALAMIIFGGQSYFLIRGIMQGYEYGFSIDLTHDLTVQYLAIWIKVAANALVWVAFGMLARLQISAIDELNSERNLTASNASGTLKDA